MYLFSYFSFSVAFSSGRGDAHQSYDAVLEEFNKDLKAWVYGEPDADVWRSIIRNHDALMDLRHEMFSLFALADPKSQERKRPSYTKELLEWRACLRPFLVNNDGVPAAEWPLESMSGLPLSQDAMHLVQSVTLLMLVNQEYYYPVRDPSSLLCCDTIEYNNLSLFIFIYLSQRQQLL